MSIWLFLWFIFAVILIGATAWSTIILIQQKKAWKAFAAKHNLTFIPGKFFAPCEMQGSYKGYEVSFFTAEQQNPEERKNRQVTVFQLGVPKPFVDGVVMGSPNVKNFIDILEGLSPHKIHSPVFRKEWIVVSRHEQAVDHYLTEERLKILNGLLAFPKSDNLIILDGSEGAFRFETSNPLADEQKLQTLTDKIIARVERLIPSEEEAKRLEAMVGENQKADTPDESAAQSEAIKGK